MLALIDKRIRLFRMNLYYLDLTVVTADRTFFFHYSNLSARVAEAPMESYSIIQFTDYVVFVIFSIKLFWAHILSHLTPSYPMAVTLLRLPKLCRDLIGTCSSNIAPPTSVDPFCSEVDVLGLGIATIFAWFEFSFNRRVSLGPVLDPHIYLNGRYSIKTTYFMSGL